MAITPKNKAYSADIDYANLTRTLVAFDCGSGADYLLVGVATRDGSDANIQPSGVTYNGVSLTKVTSTQSFAGGGGGQPGTSLWYLASPASGAHDIVVTMGAATYMAIDASAWAGVDSSASSSTGAAVGGAAGTRTLAAGDVLVGSCDSYNGGPLSSDGTALSSGGGLASNYYASAYKTGTGSVTLTFSGGVSPVCSSYMVLKAAAGGTPPGLATETDTALALSGKQIRALGLATETDAALALTGAALAGLPFNTSAYEFGQRTGLDIEDFSLYASTSLNVSVFADADVLLASRLFAYTESTGSDGRLTRKTHASLTASNWYFFVARNADGSLSGCGRIQAT